MTEYASLTSRVLNFFTFAQKFIAICILFAVTIGSLAFMLLQMQLDKLRVINVELAGIRYDRPIMQLLQDLIEHQQTNQRYRLGDHSLDGVLGHLEQRVNEGLNDLIQRDQSVGEALLVAGGPALSLEADVTPVAIKKAWESLLSKSDGLTIEQVLEGHVKLITLLRSLADFIQDSTSLQPDTDLASHYLMQVLYTKVPQLQQEMMQLASLGETVASTSKADRLQQDGLIGGATLVEHHSDRLVETTWKAIKARKAANGDLTLKASVEGPLSDLTSSILRMLEYVRGNMLAGEKNEASLGTYVVIATRALNEGFQFANAASEQLERLLTQRHDSMVTQAQLVGAGIFACTLLAFLFSFILFRAMFLPLKNLVSAAEQLAKGNLSVRVPILQSDEIAEVGKAFNHMAGSMEEILSQLQSAGVQLTTSTTQMAAVAKEQEATIVQQETATKQIAVTAKEISLTASEFAGTIQDVTHSAEEASSLATTGKDALHQMKNIMQNMVNASSEIANQLSTLNDKTNTITGVITTITKVADRTNLLSLNAAIEAHKIGDKGGGFSVIAAEIRRLADQTAYATLDIEKVVNQMVSAVAASVEGMGKFSEDIRKGVEQATSISGLLTKIIAQVQQQTSTFEMVNQGMEAQSVGAKQITESIEELSGVAQQSTGSIKQFHTALDQLSGAIKDLQNTVSRLQAEGKTTPAPAEV
jgi:methyl-accepting chemotaxis protein